MSFEFRLLGTVEAVHDGKLVDLGPGKQRAVLAALLVDANDVVSVDLLVSRVWGDTPPHHPQNTLYTYLSRLRRALAGAEEVSLERRCGYLIRVDDSAIDLNRFHRLVEQAGDAADDTAKRLFDQAFALWQGQPLSGLDTPWANEVRNAAQQAKHHAELDHADVELRRGGHAALVLRLATLAAEHPLDERLTGQLMLALYRCGRQHEALEQYRRSAVLMAEELGVDLSPPLRELHRRILAADPALSTPERAVEVRSAADTAATRLVPRHLPAAPWGFVGRERELAELSTALSGQKDGTRIPVVTGPGGVGKTWLALRWAHQHADHFPDGQLYLDLRGFTPGKEPLAPETAVRDLLHALGVEQAHVPVGSGATALYRGLLAERRVLVVLDNARDAAQVIPLLPGGRSSCVLVTSRDRLGGLVTGHGGASLRLGPLSEAAAFSLLALHLGGDRVTTERGAVSALLEGCARLPLALRIMAVRAAMAPDLPLSALAEEVRDERTRLDALTIGDDVADLRVALSATYSALSADAAWLLGLVSLEPGDDIELTSAATLAGLPTSRTRTLLREAVNTHLLDQHAPNRYRMSDLDRRYAAERAAGALPSEHRPAALRRPLPRLARESTSSKSPNAVFSDRQVALMDVQPCCSDQLTQVRPTRSHSCAAARERRCQVVTPFMVRIPQRES
ncbi:DNA-binding SARP family transcriptional activator [Saccharothrix coeruleofusca]|uniref:AfsR/SARP family transcriptional regulator n=1 Tax=Saccharothrix coeruleofusca TaxID=33919 RepID=UPI001AE88F82|nr:BTAD domain-containing putative transcriptional regulator [Saccharothrix coeruleofusca]MBP2337235.1 DNA-binding SARP family transcriptional activator [Saccharothrix coeruleofusca]